VKKLAFAIVIFSCVVVGASALDYARDVIEQRTERVKLGKGRCELLPYLEVHYGECGYEDCV
jgi:hypothetical protein